VIASTGKTQIFTLAFDHDALGGEAAPEELKKKRARRSSCRARFSFEVVEI